MNSGDLKQQLRRVKAVGRRMSDRIGGPAIDDRETLHRFWRQPAPDGNVPADYIAHSRRSEVLVEMVGDIVEPGARILEVGCNVGRNLAYLKDAGYDVTGVEISPHAVALLRETYPQLADSEVHVGAAEDVLPTLPDDGFDLVFTMAVLEHIHPDSQVVFDRIAALASNVLAIEPPGHRSHRQSPHDIKRLFEARGMRMLGSRVPMSSFGDVGEDLVRYEAYRFVRA